MVVAVNREQAEQQGNVGCEEAGEERERGEAASRLGEA